MGWQEEERWVGQRVETGTEPERALLREKVELLLRVSDRVGGGHHGWLRRRRINVEEEQQRCQHKQEI